MKNDKELKIKELIDSRLAALVLFARQWRNVAAEDIVQEAFVKLYRHEPWPDDPVAWLFAVVRNASNNYIRSDKRRKRHEERAQSARPWFLKPENDEQGKADDLAGTLARELELLDQEYREIIVAKTWGGLTFEQIAELLDSSRSTVHRKYQEGLALLQERLEGEI